MNTRLSMRELATYIKSLPAFAAVTVDTIYAHDYVSRVVTAMPAVWITTGPPSTFGLESGSAANGSVGVGSAIASGPSKCSVCSPVENPARIIQLFDIRLVADTSKPQ